MRLGDAKKAIHEIVSGFFQHANVVWAEQGNTKPPVPYVTMKLGRISRPRDYVGGEDGPMKDVTVPLTIDLYTKGRPVTLQKGKTTVYEDTALDDMNDFVNYLESEGVSLKLFDLGMRFDLSNDILDLSFLENSTQFQYRAEAVFRIQFRELMDGLYGTLQMNSEINPSGGGIEDRPLSVIDEVEEGGNN